MNNKKITIIIAFIILFLALGFVAYQYYLLDIEVVETKEKVDELETGLNEMTHNNSLLVENFQNERLRNEEFEYRIRQVISTIDELERVNETDKELLQKYSKVYFLNEHYSPPELTSIPSKYLNSEEDSERIHAEVWPFLEDMIESADDDGVNLYIVSGYRSFGEQTELKQDYIVTFGAGTANQFSAEQGYSEHQLGTTVDLTTDGVSESLDGFEDTEAYEWLIDNAHEYGFTLSYPEDNDYYQFEPWHWRFVGTDLATSLHNEDQHFYDISQREIDEYLLEIFD